MVVGTHKLSHSRFDRPQAVFAEYLESGFHEHLKVASRMSVRARADFIIANIAKGSFIVVGVKRNVRQVGTRQIASYSQMPIIARGHYIPPPELIKVARPIELSYLNQELVEAFLGSQGEYVLKQVLSLVKDLALEMDWPLDKVEIRYVRDPEVKDWEYVLLLLVFTCDFDTADRYLHELYNQIDMLSDELSDDEKEILRRVIFFDIEAKASIPGD